MNVYSERARMRAALPLLALATLAGCGGSGEEPSFGSRAMAANAPAPVVAPEVVQAPVDAPLELEAVDERPVIASAPIVRPACLVANEPCAFGKDAWVESREGFVTRWAMAQVDAKSRKQTDPVALAQGATLKPLVVPGPVVELAPDGKLEGRAVGPVWVLAAKVHVDKAQPARMMVSVNGQAHVALNGKLVHEERGDQYLLLDHRTVKVELVQGWNTIAVRLEKISPYAVKLALRLRAIDGAALPSAWAIEGAGGGICDALKVALEPRVTKTGWTIGAKAEAKGLVPWPMPAKLALRVGAVASEALFDGDAAAVAVDVPDAAAPIAIEVDGTRCLAKELKVVAARSRYLVAREKLDGVLAANTNLGPGDRESLQYQADDAQRLLEGAAVGDASRRLEGALQHFEAHVSGVASGGKPFVEPGLHIRAYRSDYDGALQRYVVVVPKVYAKTDAAPLVMLAHGLEYTPEDMMRIALAKPSGPGEALRSGAIYKWDPPEPPSGAILVAHDGYGNAGQRAPGEVDVRRVIDEMKAAYRIDPRRVSISGFSLGGSVAFWVPFHAPSVFSASAPLCGYPNILEYRSVKAATKKAWEPRLLEEDGVAPYAEGGKYLPLKMVHGAMDGPSRSELLHNRYKTLRYPSELDIPQLGHNVWDHAFEDGTLLKWLAARKRPAVAPQPVVRSGRYRWSTNYWLAIDRFEDEAQFGQLDGSFKGERIQVSARNVAAFSVLGRELGERADKPQTIVVEGKNLGEHTIGLDGQLHLSRGAKGWEVSAAVERPAGGKRAGVEGPIGDAWFGPLVVVYGTQVVNEIEANRLTAERLSMHAPWIDLRVPVLADVEVSDADLVGKSIILVGRPATNLVTRRFATDLERAGFRFVEGALMVGERRFEGPEIGLSVVRPSPWDAARYVVLHAGVGIDGTLSARYLPELSPDYLVYDSRMRAVFGDRILGAREALLGGFFDAAWELESR